VKLRAAEDLFYYPDLMVACGPEGESSLYEDSPCLIVEVTSPSTAFIDRHEKMLAYRRIPSLGAYLIFDQESPGWNVTGATSAGSGYRARS
jgi:Uma2 family endonuclease